MNLLIIPRSKWTKEARGGEPLNTPVADLYLHHTAGPMPAGGRKATPEVEQALIRATRNFHISGRGMSDIAYNYGVMPSGRCYDLRGIRTGGHTYGQNSTSLAIVTFGNYQTATPSEEMVNGIRFLRRRLKLRRRLTKNHDFSPHSAAPGAATACPGDKLYKEFF